MRRLILAFCLIASICAYHVKVPNVAIEYVKIGKIAAPRLNLDLNHLAKNEELVKLLVDLSEKVPLSGTEAILNDYADKIFADLDNVIVENGVDPVSLPEVHEGFNYTLIITYWGVVDLQNGWLSDISTIHRGGDVVVDYSTEDKYLEITVPIAFRDLSFTYDYDAELMGLGPRGYIDGIVSDLTIEVILGFHADTIQFTFENFYITHSGNIDVEFHGDDLIDWLLNLILVIIDEPLKEALLLVVEDIVRGPLESAVDSINEAINEAINPTTSAAPLFLS